MPSHFLAIDAGTTTVRAMVIDGEGKVVGKSRTSVAMVHPGPGRAEQDPEAYWNATLNSMKAALADANIGPQDITAIGIATQRTCCIVWDGDSGEALSPIVSWQDLRGIQRAAELQEAGFLILPYAAACKLESIIKNIDQENLRWGNVDMFIASRLTANRVHATDPSQGCTTGYYDFVTGEWSQSLLSLQKLDKVLFPKLVPSIGVCGETDSEIFGASVPIASIIGDQQSAALAHGCIRPGDGQVTFGTSATVNVCTGDTIAHAEGAYPLVLYSDAAATHYALEAMVVTAGAFIDWLALSMGIARSPADIGPLAESLGDSDGVMVLPALQGLGSPHGDSSRTAEIHGITRGANAAHIARASLEGIAFRVREAIEAVYAGLEAPIPKTLRVDGGATQCEALMQIQADTLGRPVEVLDPHEATAYGAALLAGVGVGHWKMDDIHSLGKISKRYEPTWTDAQRDSKFGTWKKTFNIA